LSGAACQKQAAEEAYIRHVFGARNLRAHLAESIIADYFRGCNGCASGTISGLMREMKSTQMKARKYKRIS